MTFSNSDSENLLRIARALERSADADEGRNDLLIEDSANRKTAWEESQRETEARFRTLLAVPDRDSPITTGSRPLTARRFLLHPAVAKPAGATFEGVEFTDGWVVVARSDGSFTAYENIEQMFSTWQRDSIEWID